MSTVDAAGNDNRSPRHRCRRGNPRAAGRAGREDRRRSGRAVRARGAGAARGAEAGRPRRLRDAAGAIEKSRMPGDGARRRDRRGKRRSGGRGPTQADILIDLAQSAELFHAPDGTGFADLDINGHRETWPIRAKGFRRWLARRFFEATGGAPSSEALQSALNVIEAKAHFDAPERLSDRRGGRHVEVVVEPDLVECDFGEWDGMTFAEVRAAYPDELDRWLASTARRATRRRVAAAGRPSGCGARCGRLQQQ